MQGKQGLVLRVVALLSVMCSGLAFGFGVPVVQAQPTFTVVAKDLDNPRGLSFGPNGSLYVAEAGKGGSGPCITSPEGMPNCYGPTGAITRVISGTQTRVVTGLPSLAGNNGASATGPHHLSFLSNGDAYLTIGLGANPAVRATLGTTGTQFGQLMRVDLAGKTTQVADIAGYEATNDPVPATGGPDSNPYAVLALHDQQFVVDAGGNDLLRVAPDGTITTVMTFTSRLVTAPPGFPAPQIPMQSVPNSLAVGPDGAMYVGELTGFPFPVGGARVYRVVPGQAPQIYAQNLTNIIDMAFAADGSLYVLEIAANGLGNAFQTGTFEGALIKVAADGTQTPVVTSGLQAPGGLAISPSGGIYIANNGLVPGQGQVVRVDLCAAGATNCSEPMPLATPFVATLSGANEVDANGARNKGDLDGSGSVVITIDPAKGQACVQGSVTNVAPLMMAHIHRGAAGTNGPVVVPFNNAITGDTLSGCSTADAALLTDIAANPSNYYFNVHNADFTAGALRGQLVRANTAAASHFIFLPSVRKP